MQRPARAKFVSLSRCLYRERIMGHCREAPEGAVQTEPFQAKRYARPYWAQALPFVMKGPHMDARREQDRALAGPKSPSHRLGRQRRAAFRSSKPPIPRVSPALPGPMARWPRPKAPIQRVSPGLPEPSAGHCLGLRCLKHSGSDRRSARTSCWRQNIIEEATLGGPPRSWGLTMSSTAHSSCTVATALVIPSTCPSTVQEH
jgi:hypothetical protein